MWLLAFLGVLLAACGGSGTATISQHSTSLTPRQTTSPAKKQSYTYTQCAGRSQQVGCLTPYGMREAYGIQPLIEKGFTGKGQTIVLIESFGSPDLQNDVDIFDKQFDLPSITIQQISPLDESPYDPHDDRVAWKTETTADVEEIHAIAPDAKIVVLVSPVAETQGTVGLPEFRQLIQYAIDHKLGNIISQSWGASEATLKDAAGQAEIQKWDALYKIAATQDHVSVLSGSGDNGATSYSNVQETQFASTPTVNFPSDDPWVTSVGGTSLQLNGATFTETGWLGSSGGFSAFFSEPTYQQTLPASVQQLMQNRRGIPDVAANADGFDGQAVYVSGQWFPFGGTSASSPLWAGMIAIANQMAGHPLGFLNPALYKLAGTSHYQQDFHDITTGNNTMSGNGVFVKGYNAVPGWDAITGLGTPNAAKLLPDLIAASNS